MQTASDPEKSLTGHYTLHPGQHPPIRGGRPVLAPGRLAALLRGQRLETLLPAVGSLFTLCAHAHRDCAQRAVAAAQGNITDDPEGDTWLHWETARDHMRCMALEWPQRLHRDVAEHLPWWRSCPLSWTPRRPEHRAEQALTELQALGSWLELHALHQPLAAWRTQTASVPALVAWCQAQTTHIPVAQTLAGAWSQMQSPALPLRALPLGDLVATAGTLAELAWSNPSFCAHPQWQGGCAENGPWLRQHHAASADVSPWWRLAARWVEWVALAGYALQPVPGAPILRRGALSLASGCGVAWCEMARGLLLHSVRTDDQGRVQDYRVLAPTEWNFHPQGSLGQAVASLAPDDRNSARLLAAAFDPCVACL